MASSNTTGSECLTDYTTCDVHKTEQIVKYCSTHNVLICRLCEITSHVSCEKATNKDKAKETNQKVSMHAFLGKFQALEKEVDELKTRQESHKKTYLIKLQECDKEVKKARKKVDAHFDKLEKKLSTSIHKLEQELLSTAKSRVEACEHYIDRIEKEIKKLEAFESTDDDETIFIGRTKSTAVYDDCEKVYKNLQSGFFEKYPKVLINSKISRLVDDLKEIGQVAEVMALNTDVEEEISAVTTGTFLSDGRMIVSYRYLGVILLYNADGSLQSKLNCSLYHKFAEFSQNLLVGTVPESREIHFLRVNSQTVSVEKKIKTDRPCYGICVLNNKLFVSCVDGATPFPQPGDGEVIILSRDAKLHARCNKSKTGQLIFMRPLSLCVRSMNSIIVVDQATRRIASISENGKDISLLDIILPETPYSICKGARDTYYIGLVRSICIMKGTKVDKFLDMDSGGPGTISYRENDGALLVEGAREGLQSIFWLK